MEASAYRSVVIEGRVAEGIKESSFFTNLPWVREQFKTKLGIDPYPGTLNLDIVTPENLAKLKEIKKRPGIEIIPADTAFCAAKCFNVLLGGKLKGAVVIPQVPGYSESKLEIIAAVRIRDALSLEVGDLVRVEIL